MYAPDLYLNKYKFKFKLTSNASTNVNHLNSLFFFIKVYTGKTLQFKIVRLQNRLHILKVCKPKFLSTSLPIVRAAS